MERRGELRHRLGVSRHLLKDVVEILLQCAAKLCDIGSAIEQDLACGGVLEQSEKQVLERHEFVLVLYRLIDGVAQCFFKLACQHLGYLSKVELRAKFLLLMR